MTRTAYDRSLEQPEPRPDVPEVVGLCPTCGLDGYDHIRIQCVDDFGNDYETLVCPPLLRCVDCDFTTRVVYDAAAHSYAADPGTHRTVGATT